MFFWSNQLIVPSHGCEGNAFRHEVPAWIHDGDLQWGTQGIGISHSRGSTHYSWKCECNAHDTSSCSSYAGEPGTSGPCRWRSRTPTFAPFCQSVWKTCSKCFQASGAVAPDDGDCELMVEAKEHLRRFMETLEGIAFLLCEFTKMVRFLTTEAAMYRRGFDWSQCMDNQVMHHLDRCTKRWVQGPWLVWQDLEHHWETVT